MERNKVRKDEKIEEALSAQELDEDVKKEPSNKALFKQWWFWAICAGVIVIVSLAIVIFTLIGKQPTDTAGDNGSAQSSQSSQRSGVVQKTSSDTNVAYVKQFVGQNLASACGWSWVNKCLFELRAGDKRVNLKVNITSSDGRDFSGDDMAKFYKITSQSIPQNTEISVSWDEDGDWTLLPDEIDVTVEPIGKLKEVTKSGEIERYLCSSKGDHTGRVVNFIKKNSSSGLQSDSYDIVNCEWTELVQE